MDDDITTVPRDFQAEYQRRVAGLKSALRTERTWNKTVRRLCALHPELTQVLKEADILVGIRNHHTQGA